MVLLSSSKNEKDALTYHKSSFRKDWLAISFVHGCCSVDLWLWRGRLAGQTQTGSCPDQSLDIVWGGGRVFGQGGGQAGQDLRVQVELQAKCRKGCSGVNESSIDAHIVPGTRHRSAQTDKGQKDKVGF